MSDQFPSPEQPDSNESSSIGLGCVVFFVAVCVFGIWFVAPFLLACAYPDLQERGQFGDAYGVINSLFSAAALIGTCYVLLLQTQQIKDQAKAEAESRKHLSEQTELLRKQLQLQTQQINDQAIGEAESRKHLSDQTDLLRKQLETDRAELKHRTDPLFSTREIEPNAWHLTIHVRNVGAPVANPQFELEPPIQHHFITLRLYPEPAHFAIIVNRDQTKMGYTREPFPDLRFRFRCQNLLGSQVSNVYILKSGSTVLELETPQQ